MREKAMKRAIGAWLVCGLAVACSSAEGTPAPGTGGGNPTGGGATGGSAMAGTSSASAGTSSTSAGTSSTSAGTSGSGSSGGSGGQAPVGGTASMAGASGMATTGGSGGASGGSGGDGGGSPTTGGSSGASGSGGASGGSPPTVDVAFCTTALDAAAAQFAGFRTTYTNPNNVPRAAKNGQVTSVALSDWTSGFPGGSLWLVYEYTKDQAFRTAAESFTAALESQKNNAADHDVGFRFMSTFGNAHRLVGGDNYLNVLKTAAATLATRFRPAPKVIESWGDPQWDCPVIIDNMMNLHLWYYVAEKGGDQGLIALANQHAETTLKNHFRPDGSSFHLVNYNSSTGAVIGKQTVQGLANGSPWARGQSWGLYGYTESFVSTQKAEFLAQAQKIADYLLAQPNMPEDKVPYWDYDAPTTPGTPTPRDSSAAAIMASGLIQLSGLVAEPARSKYRDFALEVLRSLSSPAYAAALGQNNHFLLMHSTGHLPANSEIDVAINYADYYYLEALLRCRGLAAP
jgi:hypothetical protein